MLGWDITDFGSGDFDKIGFSLITIRNGNRKMADKYPKVYAEKLLYLKEGQSAANHFHWFKTEDIINRGGGNALIRVYNSLPDEEIDYISDVTIHSDGRTYTVPAGTQIRLTPARASSFIRGLYHDFNVEPGTGPVLLGEVSQCNDDNTDNRFNPPAGRFPKSRKTKRPTACSATSTRRPDKHAASQMARNLRSVRAELHAPALRKCSATLTQEMTYSTSAVCWTGVKLPLIQVARQPGANIEREIALLAQLCEPIYPKVLDHGASPAPWSLTEELPDSAFPSCWAKTSRLPLFPI